MNQTYCPAFRVQKTAWAYVSNAEVPARSWTTYSRHNKQERAVAAARKLLKRACYSGGRHYNVRLVNMDGANVEFEDKEG